MTADRHAELLDLVRRCKGTVKLSGYTSDLYDRELGSWKWHTFTIHNHAAGGKRKRRMVEVVWCNF